MKRYADNRAFALCYRVAALVIIAAGLADISGLLSGEINPHVFLSYTVQSNVLVWLFFAFCTIKTARAKVGQHYPFGFWPAASFAVTIAILITMLLFWAILAPTSWAGGHLLTFSNFAVHLICPILMIFDRFIFYQPGKIGRLEPLAVFIFPYMHVAQSFIIGLNRLVYFAPLRIESYYIYPFLDYDAQGNMVFLYILGLSLIFLGISYGWRHLENKYAAKRK